MSDININTFESVNSNIGLVTPSSSRLFFNKGNEKQKEIELVQFLKYRIDDNKKPIFGFTNQSFSKTIKGKRIVSGYIGIKKTSIDIVGSIISSISSKTVTETYQASKAKAILDIMNSGTKSSDIDKEAFLNFYDTYVKSLSDRIKKNSLVKVSGSYFLDIESDNGLSPFSLSIINEKLNSSDCKELEVQNVTFVSREGEYSISQNTVLEVYGFIGNS